MSMDVSKTEHLRTTFLLPATEPTDSVAGDLVSAGDHLVQTFISQIGFEAALHDGKEILYVVFSGPLMEFYASVKPANRSPHCLLYSRSDSQTGY